MKKQVLLTVLFAFGIIQLSFGQPSLNLTSGINYSTYTFENFELIKPEPSLGYFIGVAPNMRLTKSLGIQVDFQYSLKGYNFSAGNNTVQNKYAYLEIIPELEWYLHRFVALGIGVNYGTKVSERIKLSNTDWTKPVTNIANSNDLGLTAKLKLDFNKIFAFVRYYHGMKNISSLDYIDSKGKTVDDAKLLNRNLQIGVGYKLDF